MRDVHRLLSKCLKELLQVQKNLTAALKKLNVTSVHAVAMKMERDAVTTKYEELHLSVGQRMAFATKKKGSSRGGGY